ncbi:hypothetical protein [Endozoicomonas sp. 4G]|uniref:hypothetical protein n=1 Tax=Endozoicomonas sp. 4G TaxID=2872754 RepID=UPI002078E7DB|nr:hypothetical protein [Endozoicomonas sp. 4G]
MTETKRGPGRPPADNPIATRQISILLPLNLVEKARRIGDDNLTEGVRRALRAYREKGENP